MVRRFVRPIQEPRVLGLAGRVDDGAIGVVSQGRVENPLTVVVGRVVSRLDGFDDGVLAAAVVGPTRVGGRVSRAKGNRVVGCLIVFRVIIVPKVDDGLRQAIRDTGTRPGNGLDDDPVRVLHGNSNRVHGHQLPQRVPGLDLRKDVVLHGRAPVDGLAAARRVRCLGLLVDVVLDGVSQARGIRVIVQVQGRERRRSRVIVGVAQSSGLDIGFQGRGRVLEQGYVHRGRRSLGHVEALLPRNVLGEAPAQGTLVQDLEATRVRWNVHDFLVPRQGIRVRVQRVTTQGEPGTTQDRVDPAADAATPVLDIVLLDFRQLLGARVRVEPGKVFLCHRDAVPTEVLGLIVFQGLLVGRNAGRPRQVLGIPIVLKATGEDRRTTRRTSAGGHTGAIRAPFLAAGAAAIGVSRAAKVVRTDNATRAIRARHLAGWANRRTGAGSAANVVRAKGLAKGAGTRAGANGQASAVLAPLLTSSTTTIRVGRAANIVRADHSTGSIRAKRLAGEARGLTSAKGPAYAVRATLLTRTTTTIRVRRATNMVLAEFLAVGAKRAGAGRPARVVRADDATRTIPAQGFAEGTRRVRETSCPAAAIRANDSTRAVRALGLAG